MVDMRLGIGKLPSISADVVSLTPADSTVAIIFFLWRHYTIQHERENDNAKEEREKEKKDISKKLSEAKKGGASSKEIQKLQMMMEELE